MQVSVLETPRFVVVEVNGEAWQPQKALGRLSYPENLPNEIWTSPGEYLNATPAQLMSSHLL